MSRDFRKSQYIYISLSDRGKIIQETTTNRPESRTKALHQLKGAGTGPIIFLGILQLFSLDFSRFFSGLEKKLILGLDNMGYPMI